MLTKTNEEPTTILNVEYAISRQPIPYNNVRAAISLPVFVKESDDIEEKIIKAFDQARSYVQDEIDRQFETFGEPAPYSREPRFKVLSMGIKHKAIVPQEIELASLPGNWRHAGIEDQGHRLPYLSGKYPNAYRFYRSDVPLPDLHNYRLVYNQNDRVRLVLWISTDLTNERYDYLRKNYPGTFYTQSLTWCTADEGLAKLNEWLEVKGEMTIVDLRDGDWSKLPPPPESPAELLEADGAPGIDYYEHDSDRWDADDDDDEDDDDWEDAEIDEER